VKGAQFSIWVGEYEVMLGAGKGYVVTRLPGPFPASLYAKTLQCYTTPTVTLLSANPVRSLLA
jgi:hypothetical protein